MSITKAISSHTPGPWTFEPQDGHPGHGILAQVFGPDDNSIADIDPTYPPTVANANARLIAAAPVLLVALKDAANFLAIAAQDIIRGGDGKINESWATDIQEAERRARDAISQATVAL